MLKPLKLFTVFLHEWGHAMAVWMTCGKVTGIEVNSDEGGMTYWKSTHAACANHAVLPAGYLGSAFWGCYVVLSSSTPTATRIAAFVLCVFCAIALGYATCSQHKSLVLAMVAGGMLVLLGGLLVVVYVCVDFDGGDDLLRLVLLLIGTLNTIFATVDIYDDAIVRTVERSDAYRYAQLYRCCLPKCVGVCWIVIAIAMNVCALYLSLLIMEGAPIQFNELSGQDLIWMAIPLALCFLALLWRCLCGQ